MAIAVDVPGRGTIQAAVPREAVRIESDWDTLGLRATASNSFQVLPNTVVPPTRWLDRSAPLEPLADGPALTHFAATTYLSALFAAVALGNAAGALADLIELARVKTPLGFSSTLAANPVTWRDLGQAAAELQSAHQSLLFSLQSQWQSVLAGVRPTELEQAAIRAVCAASARTAAQVVRTAFDLAGGSSVYRSSALDRRLRDAQVLIQHYYLSQRSFDVHGRMLLRQELQPWELAMLRR